ncbi:hypothetical protein [Photobacterium kishitanii]|uniref:hypothetical protein n=1 Tax=Photobacterium kishitanii TaxID=318456 RepID=UPI000D1748F8|nr:hypothetical protein [Photobacterium kishitanii]PSV25496.1 hypothetical protein C0W28_00820 [Photobacterium kishitanii]
MAIQNDKETLHDAGYDIGIAWFMANDEEKKEIVNLAIDQAENMSKKLSEALGVLGIKNESI